MPVLGHYLPAAGTAGMVQGCPPHTESRNAAGSQASCRPTPHLHEPPEATLRLVSFLGHTLPFSLHESLVGVLLDTNHVDASPRIDLPTRENGLGYAA